jgi:hypothetical protein
VRKGERRVDQEQKPRERAFLKELVPDWRPTRQQRLWAVRLVIVIVVLVVLTLLGLPFGISLWDWIKLLVIPVVIAGGGLWFNAQQREGEQRIANERAQDEALQAYLDQMSGMLIPASKDLPSLYKARPGDSLSSVARARTLTVLPRLDGGRKARVVPFVYESGLISSARRALDLKGADLREADLRYANLSGANLTDANVTQWQLEQARSLEGATMPNGQKYEDWLEDRREGKNSSPS